MEKARRNGEREKQVPGTRAGYARPGFYEPALVTCHFMRRPLRLSLSFSLSASAVPSALLRARLHCALYDSLLKKLINPRARASFAKNLFRRVSRLHRHGFFWRSVGAAFHLCNLEFARSK